MRKTAVLLLILLLIGAGSFVFIHCTLLAERDQVKYTEEILYGNKEVASGLSVHCGMENDGHLVWDTTFSPQDIEQAQTQYAFFSEKVNWNRETMYLGVVLENYFEYGCNFEEPAEKQEGLAKAYKELYDKTPIGEESSMTIQLKDYYEYYPLHIRLSVPGFEHFHFEIQETNSSIYDPFMAFFRFPLLGDEKVEISIERKSSDAIGIGSGTEDYFGLYTESVITADAVYFTFNTHAKMSSVQEFRVIDTSQIPGGYGIYKLPYGKDEEGETVVFADQLEMVYGLDPQIFFQGIYLNDHEDKVLLFTTEENREILTIIDLESMRTLQRIELTDDRNDVQMYNVTIQEKFVVLGFSDDRIMLLEETENGTYEVRISVYNAVKDISNDYSHMLNDDYSAVAYDGKRLAIVSQVSNDQWSNVLQGDVLVSVFDQNGLQYCGRYNSTLTDQIGPNEYRYFNRKYGPLQASWN